MKLVKSQKEISTEQEGEACQRCGVVGQGRRTLYMACLCDMGELSIPFDEEKKVISRVQIRPEHSFVSEQTARLFTLRVCKGCRLEWMGALEVWFTKSRSPNIDENGITTL